MRCYVKTWPPSCIMKVDLHKAFDPIHWDFLTELLNALKFPPLHTMDNEVHYPCVIYYKHQ